MVVFLLFALTCSTEPTTLPVAQWRHLTFVAGHFEITYPPCWTLSSETSSDAGLILLSPDASFDISVQFREQHLARSAAEIQFGELSRNHERCTVGGKRHKCVAWEDRSGFHKFIPIFVGNRGYLIYVSSHDSSAEKWNSEAATILRTLKFTTDKGAG